MHVIENTELMKCFHSTEVDGVLTHPANGGRVMLANYLRLSLVLNVRWTIHVETPPPANFGIASGLDDTE